VKRKKVIERSWVTVVEMIVANRNFAA